MCEKDDVLSENNSVLREEEPNRWDIALDSLDAYYSSFPESKPSACFLMRLIFQILYSMFGITVYNQKLFHEIIYKIKSENSTDLFVNSIMEQITFGYRNYYGTRIMYSDELDVAITEFQNSGIIALDAADNYHSFKYLPGEKRDYLEIIDVFAKEAKEKYNIEIKSDELTRFIEKIIIHFT